MTDTRKSLRRGAVRLFAALVPATLLVSAAPAEAKWLSKPAAAAAGGVVAGGVGSSLRKHLGELPDRGREALDAFFRDDADGLDGIFEESLRLPGKIGMDAHPVLATATSLGDAAKNAASDAKNNLKKGLERLESAKRSIGRLVGRAGETVTDIRAALAIDRDERQWYESEARVLDKAPLPSVKVPRTREAPDSSPRSLAEAWGMDAETIRRSRDPAVWAAKPDPWGQDTGKGWDSPPAPPAAAKVDVWSDDAAGKGEQSRPGGTPVASADPWGQNTGQGWASAATTPVVGDVGTDPVDAEWQSEYAAALNHFLGLDDEDSSYEAALIEVERLELEAVRRQEERERQARLAAEERERQARLAKRRRIEAQERERQAELERQRRIESASRERRRQTLQNIQRSAASIATAVENAAAAVRNAQSRSGRRGYAPKEKCCGTGSH